MSFLSKVTSAVLATTIATGGLTVPTFTTTDLVRTMNAFLGAYGLGNGDYRTDLQNAEPLHFWEASFIRQTLTDASRLTGQWKDQVSQAYYRYENTHSTDRFGNP